MTEINDKYVRNYMEQKGATDIQQNKVDNLESLMRKYGDNHWWESNDPVVLAMYQTFEDVTIAKWDEFYPGLKFLIDHSITVSSYALDLTYVRVVALDKISELSERLGKYQREARKALDYLSKSGFTANLKKQMEEEGIL